MTRRLIAAFVATALAALLLAGLGTFLLAARADRIETESNLRSEAAELASAAASAEQPIVLRALTNAAITRLLRIDGSTFVRLDGTGQPIGALPAGVRRSDVAPVASAPEGVTSGRRGRLVYAAASADLPGGGRIVAVLTERSGGGLASARKWFALASAIVLALSIIAAFLVGRRLTRPIRDVEAATRRITGGELSTRLDMPPRHHVDEVSDLVRSINSMAESLQRSKGVEQQFLMSISHDLRTPLTSIRGYAEAINDGTMRDVGPAAGIILNETRRLERLVRDLLDLATLQARSFSFRHERVDLAMVARSAVEGLSTDSFGLTIRCDVADNVPVWADRDRLDQVVGNLVENARKFAASVITVGARSVGDVAMLWVDDDGPGISPTDRPHVFERLYVSTDRPVRAEAGSGLGLAIVAELISGMGGTVAAEKAPAGGARMVARLPVFDGLAADRRSGT